MDSSPMPVTLHLAMAALFGASFMAVSAFYIHRRSVDQVLRRLAEVRRSHPSQPRRRRNRQLRQQATDDDDDEDDDDGDDDRLWFVPDGGGTVVDAGSYPRSLSRSLDDNVLRSHRISSSSLPNADSSRTGWFEAEENPPLRTDVGGNAQISSSYKRMSPGRNAFESAEGSDEEASHLADDNLVPYGPNSNICHLSNVSFRGQDANCAKNQMHIEISKSENDLAFVNTLLPPRNTAHESTSVEEEEVCKMIRECLDLRKKYVYKEKVAPWKAEPVPKSSDPFHFEPIEATAHHFRMEDGVVHVYASKNVMSSGNVRSACHHRLRFLEEIGSFWPIRVHHTEIFIIFEKLILIFIILPA